MNETELHEALVSLRRAQEHYEMDIAKYGGNHHMSKYTDQKISEAIVYLDGKISKLAERVECNKAAQDAINLNQATLNTANGSAIACIQNEVARINSAFKFIIPNDSLCPGWGKVTVTPAAATAAAG